MPSTDTYRFELEELDTLARRIKNGRTADDLRRVLSQMNESTPNLPDSSLVLAQYNYLRGVLYVKGAMAMAPGSWVFSAGDSLLNALDRFEQASRAAAALVSSYPTPRNVKFEQDCTYEAMTAITTLKAWGRQLPDFRPRVECLTDRERRTVERHEEHAYMLRSRFA